MKFKRTVFRIHWDAATALWVAVVGQHVVFATSVKGVLLQAFHANGRLLKSQGYLSQLVVHGKNGKIQTEYTYGADPRRTKG
jgi:hypothetical protein